MHSESVNAKGVDNAKCEMHRLAAMQMLTDIWPTWAELARDLGVPYPTVGSWAKRGLPPRRIPDIIRAAKARGKDLTFEALMPLTQQPRSAPPQPKADAA